MLIGAQDTETMTPLQKQTYDMIAAGPRGGVPYPFLAMLDSPGLANVIQAVGAEIRFSGELSDLLREVAIMATAGAFGSGYEWDYHVRIARDLGMSEAIITATLTGDVKNLDGDAVSASIIQLCRASVIERRVPQDLLAALVAAIGRTAASEVVAISGYYVLLAAFLSAGQLDHPLPAG